MINAHGQIYLGLKFQLRLTGNQYTLTSTKIRHTILLKLRAVKLCEIKIQECWQEQGLGSSEEALGAGWYIVVYKHKAFLGVLGRSERWEIRTLPFPQTKKYTNWDFHSLLHPEARQNRTQNPDPVLTLSGFCWLW